MPELTLTMNSFRFIGIKSHTWHSNTCLNNVKTRERRCNLCNITATQPCPIKFAMLCKNTKVRVFSYLYIFSSEYALQSQIYKCYSTCSDNSTRSDIEITAGKSWQLLLNCLAEPNISFVSPSGSIADSVNTVTVENERLHRTTQFSVPGYPAKLMNGLSEVVIG